MRTISRRVFQVLHPAGILSRLATVGSVSTAAVYTVIKAYAVYSWLAGCQKLYLLMKSGSRCRLSKCASNLCINVTSQQFRIVSVSMFNGAAFITQCVAQSSGKADEMQDNHSKTLVTRRSLPIQSILSLELTAYTAASRIVWIQLFQRLMRCHRVFHCSKRRSTGCKLCLSIDVRIANYNLCSSACRLQDVEIKGQSEVDVFLAGISRVKMIIRSALLSMLATECVSL